MVFTSVGVSPIGLLAGLFAVGAIIMAIRRGHGYWIGLATLLIIAAFGMLLVRTSHTPTTAPIEPMAQSATAKAIIIGNECFSVVSDTAAEGSTGVSVVDIDEHADCLTVAGRIRLETADDRLDAPPVVYNNREEALTAAAGHLATKQLVDYFDRLARSMKGLPRGQLDSLRYDLRRLSHQEQAVAAARLVNRRPLQVELAEADHNAATFRVTVPIAHARNVVRHPSLLRVSEAAPRRTTSLGFGVRLGFAILLFLLAIAILKGSSRHAARASTH